MLFSSYFRAALTNKTMKKETYEQIEALTGKTTEAHEYGDQTKVIGEDEALELIKICKAFIKRSFPL